MRNQDDRPEPLAARRRLPRGRCSGWRLGISAAVGVIAAVVTVVAGGGAYAPAVGWDVTAIVFCGWIWRATWPMSPEATADEATAEDPSRSMSDILTLSAAVASLGAVAIVLVRAHSAPGADQGLLAGLGLLSVAVSWFTVHTIFTLRYALLYYADPVGGVSFNQPERPCYRDFAYLALTLGMTFQVSDTNLESTAVRATALRHALLSYLLGSIILAAAINLVAGIGSSAGVG